MYCALTDPDCSIAQEPRCIQIERRHDVCHAATVTQHFWLATCAWVLKASCLYRQVICRFVHFHTAILRGLRQEWSGRPGVCQHDHSNSRAVIKLIWVDKTSNCGSLISLPPNQGLVLAAGLTSAIAMIYLMINPEHKEYDGISL